MGDYGSALLSHARLVERDGLQAVHPGGGCQQGVDRHHARATHTRHQDAIAVPGPHLRDGLGKAHCGKLRQGLATQPRSGLDLDRDEGRAIAPSARVVGVARRLVHPCLGAVLGVHRKQGHAIRLGHAVAAALADALVDHDPPRGRRQDSPVAPTALLGRAELVVDHDAHALDLLQVREDSLQVLPRTKFGRLRESGVGTVLSGVLAHDRDAANPLCLELSRQRRHGQRSRRVLAAGHRDRVVVEDLECHVHAGRDRRLHSQKA